ncbi:MAG: hypothetical protein GC161_12205 [Planctomycetaceae bacterium]|nr:hypothetical protein [Planctomycetaceae bacterium]
MSDASPNAPSPNVTHPAPPPLWAEIVGWYGMLAILTAYGANSFDVMQKGALYQGLNLTGALGVAVVCFYRRTWQAFVLEAVWAAIALTALLT